MPSNIELANAIQASVKAREESYDHAAADAATSSKCCCHAMAAVDYTEFYGKTLEEACNEASDALSYPVYLLLKYTWNDAIMWAEEQLK